MLSQGMWGVVDVQDCSNAAMFLADSGAVDSKRLLITYAAWNDNT